MLLYTIIFFAISGIIFRNSKPLCFIIFVLIWILFWTDSTADYNSYKHIYTSDSFRDYGFSILCLIGRKIGLNFFQFYLTTSTIALLLYLKFVFRYSYCCSLCAALYLLFIVCFDIVQFRNFLAFSLILNVIPLLFYPNLKNTATYCIVVFLASTIHLTMGFFFLFAIFNKKTLSKRYLKKSLPILVIFIAILYIVTIKNSDRIESMYTAYDRGVSNTTKIALCTMVIGNILFVKYWDSRKTFLKLTTQESALTNNPYHSVLYFNILMLCILPLAFHALDVLRLFKYIAIINFAFISNKFARSSKVICIPQTITVVLYGCAYLIMFYFMHTNNFFDGVILPIT